MKSTSIRLSEDELTELERIGRTFQPMAIPPLTLARIYIQDGIKRAKKGGKK